MLRGGLSQPGNADLFKMFNLIDVGERAGSGVPDILATWDEAGYDAPTVEKRFGANVPERTIPTLPLVASLGTGLGTSVQANDQAERLLEFCPDLAARARFSATRASAPSATGGRSF